MEIKNELSVPALPHELSQQIEAAKNNLTVTEQENIRLVGLNRNLETEVGINLKKISDSKAELTEIEKKIVEGNRDLSILSKKKDEAIADAEKAKKDKEENEKAIKETQEANKLYIKQIEDDKTATREREEKVTKREEVVTIRENNADIVSQEAQKFASTIQTICKYSKDQQVQ